MQKAEQTLAAVHLHKLKEVAARCVRDLDRRQPPTRLYDNVNGRIWESALASALVENPPAEMLRAARLVGCSMQKFLESVANETEQHEIAQDLSLRLSNDFPRGWSVGEAQLVDLIELPLYDTIKNFLVRPPHTGKDCIGLYHVVVKLILSLKKVLHPDSVPWMAEADAVHNKQMQVRGRHFPHYFYATPGSGIRMIHHRAVENNKVYSHRAAVYRRYKLDRITRPMSKALETGRPLAGGLSGTTNLMLHYFEHVICADEDMQQHLEQVDSWGFDGLHALLGLMTWLTHDGGHSLHEALWVLNDISGSVDLAEEINSRLYDEKQDGNAFVSNYADFFALFEDEETQMKIAVAMDDAWTKTLEYRQSNMSDANAME